MVSMVPLWVICALSLASGADASGIPAIQCVSAADLIHTHACVRVRVLIIAQHAGSDGDRTVAEWSADRSAPAGRADQVPRPVGVVWFGVVVVG